MAITYDYYRIFYFVAKTGSFTRAATALFGSQPNITRAMNNLEQELGCRLFVRSHRGVQLTPEGERLYAHVRVAQEQLELAERELGDLKTLRGGVISVAVSEIALHGLLLPVLGRFHAAYPDVRIRLGNHSTPQAMEAVLRGEAELAVVTTPTGVRPPLCERRLTAFQDVLIASDAFAQLRGQTLSLPQLARYPLIGLGRDTKTHAFYSAMFLAEGLRYAPDIELATTDQILPLVRSGLGLGFLPSFLAGEAMQRGEVFAVQLARPAAPRHICMVLHAEREVSLAAQALQKMLADFAAHN